MRAVLQRVTEAAVEVQHRQIARIEQGLLVLLGVATGDGQPDVHRMIEKLVTLRLCADEHGKMNRSVVDVNGAVLMASQFTLLGDTTKGRRPGFEQAASPEVAQSLYGQVVSGIHERGIHVETGSFGAHMRVSLCNDGPGDVHHRHPDGRAGQATGLTDTAQNGTSG